MFTLASNRQQAAFKFLNSIQIRCDALKRKIRRMAEPSNFSSVPCLQLYSSYLQFPFDVHKVRKTYEHGFVLPLLSLNREFKEKEILEGHSRDCSFVSVHS